MSSVYGLQWDETIQYNNKKQQLSSASSEPASKYTGTDRQSDTAQLCIVSCHSESVKKSTHLIWDAILCFVGIISLCIISIVLQRAFCFQFPFVHVYTCKLQCVCGYMCRELGLYTRLNENPLELPFLSMAVCHYILCCFAFWCIEIETNTASTVSEWISLCVILNTASMQRLRNIYVSSICTIGMCWTFLHTTSRSSMPLPPTPSSFTHPYHSDAVTKVENPLQSI